MVAHDIAGAPFLLAVLVRHRTLLEWTSSVMLIMLCLSAAPIDEIQVEPCLMMATLISWT